MTVLSYVPGTEAWRERRAKALCARTGARIQEIVDGEIGSSRAAKELQKHLEACMRCRAEADVIRRLKEAIARVGRDVDPTIMRRLESLARDLSAENS